MDRETQEIRRDIASTRREIDRHLQELGGRVQEGLDVREQARRNLPALLGGLALTGLALGILLRGGRTRRKDRLAKELKRLQQERNRLKRFEQEMYSVS